MGMKKKRKVDVTLRCPECKSKHLRFVGETTQRDPSTIEFEFDVSNHRLNNGYMEDQNFQEMEVDDLSVECCDCNHGCWIDTFVEDMADKDLCDKKDVQAIIDYWTYEIEKKVNER